MMFFRYFQWLSFSEELCLRKNTFLHVKGGGDPSGLHHITASNNIINSKPNYLTISKLYSKKYH